MNRLALNRKLVSTYAPLTTSNHAQYISEAERKQERCKCLIFSIFNSCISAEPCVELVCDLLVNLLIYRHSNGPRTEQEGDTDKDVNKMLLGGTGGPPEEDAEAD